MFFKLIEYTIVKRVILMKKWRSNVLDPHGLSGRLNTTLSAPGLRVVAIMSTFRWGGLISSLTPTARTWGDIFLLM